MKRNRIYRILPGKAADSEALEKTAGSAYNSKKTDKGGNARAL